MSGIVPPAASFGNGFPKYCGITPGHRRREERDAHVGNLARLKLEHSTAEGMAFYLTTQLAKRGFPSALHVRDVEASRELDGVDRVGAYTPGFIGHQGRRKAAHVGEESIGSLHVRHYIPRVQVSTFV